MDPDQFDEAAAVDHDGPVGATASADGGRDGGGGGNDDCWARALLRRGWDLSRKAAIAGVAATAAPVVAPPLLVLAVAGVALSVPFAAYFASLAATDRLMSALLPPPPAQPHHIFDTQDEEHELEFLDAPEAPGEEDPLFNFWSETENSMQKNESSVPLSQEPRVSDVLMPPFVDKDDATTAEAKFSVEELDQESFVSISKEPTAEGRRTIMEGNQYITVEPLPPLFCNADTMVRSAGEGKFSVREPIQDSHESKIVDKIEVCKTKEDMPLREVDASKSLAMEDNGDQSNIKGEVMVDIVLQDNLVTGEVDDIAVPQAESLWAEDVCVDFPGCTETEDVFKDISESEKEGVEPPGDEGICSAIAMPTMVTVDNARDPISNTPYISAIRDDVMSLDSRTNVEHPHKNAGMETRLTNSRSDKCVETKDSKTVDGKVTTRDIDVSESPRPDDQSKREDKVSLEMVLEEMPSNIYPVTEEVDIQVDTNGSSENGPLPLNDHVVHELQAVTETGIVDDIRGSTTTEGIVKNIDNTSKGVLEHSSEKGEVTRNDGGDLLSSRSTLFVSTISDDAISVEGRPHLVHRLQHHQTTGVDYNRMNERFKMKLVAEDKDIYTEEQMRDELGTLRTIIGHQALVVPSSTLEDEIDGLYIFVGVEPPVSSRDASDLTELNMRLRCLKSIIGVR